MKLRKCYDTTKTVFVFAEGNPDNSGFMIGEDLVLVIENKRWVEDPEFYAHEFSEVTVIHLLRRWNRRFTIRYDIKFDGFKATSVTHLITPFGTNNGRNLMPSIAKRRSRAKVHKGLNS